MSCQAVLAIIAGLTVWALLVWRANIGHPDDSGASDASGAKSNDDKTHSTCPGSETVAPCGGDTRKPKPLQNAPNCYKQKRDRLDYITASGAIVAAIGAIGAAFAGIWQGHNAERAANAAIAALSLTQDQAITDRAHLWIVPADWTKRGTDERGQPNLGLSITLINRGKSVALITGFEAHMYLAGGFGGRGREPDPFNPREYSGMREAFVWTDDTRGEFFGITNSTGAPMEYHIAEPIRSIEGDHFASVYKQFFFNVPKGPVQEFFALADQWVYIVVHYRDIYGVQRSASVYERLPLGVYSTNFPQYTYWDKKDNADHSAQSTP